MNASELIDKATEAWENDKFDQAENLIRQSLALDASNALVWGMLGILLLHAKKHSEAVSAFEQALALDPTQRRFHAGLGRAYAGLDKLDEACANLRVAVQEDTKTEWLVDLGWVLFQMDDQQSAEETVRRVLEIDPNNNDALVLLARIMSCSSPQEAKKIARRACENDPNDVQALMELGMLLLLETNEYVESERTFHRALAIQEDKWLRLGLALALYKQGRFDDAEAEYKLALANNPKNDQVLRSFAGFYNDIGRYEEALNMLCIALGNNPESERTLSAFFALLDKERETPE